MSSIAPDRIPELDKEVETGSLIYLTQSHCRAVFGEDRVCGLMAPECNRPDHRDLLKSAPGYYANHGKLRANSQGPDGEAGTLVYAPDFAPTTGVPSSDNLPPVETVTEGDDEDELVFFVREDAPKGTPPDNGDQVTLKPPAETNAGADESDPDEEDYRATLLALEQEKSKLLAKREALAQVVPDLEKRAKENLSVNLRRAQAKAARQAAEKEVQELEDEIQALGARKAAALKHLEPSVTERSGGWTGGTTSWDRSRIPPLRGPRASTHNQVPNTRAGRPDHYVTLPKEEGPGPLQYPLGRDPDTAKDVVHGRSVHDAEGIFEDMMPRDFDPRLHGELKNSLPDVTSVSPGTFTQAQDSTQYDIAQGMMNALENQAASNSLQQGFFVKEDASWNSLSRVGIYKVKTKSDWDKLYISHENSERDFHGRFTGNIRSLLHHYGYGDQDAMSFAETSRYSLLVMRCHDLYGRFLGHIQREIEKSTFSVVRPVIDVFATKFVQYRSNQTRLSMWICTYAYLRHLYFEQYWTPDRQLAVNRKLLAGVGEEDGGGGSSSSTQTCQYCGGHSTSVTCPFKDKGISRNQVKKMANKAKNMPGKFTPNAKTLISDWQKANEDSTKNE